MEYFAGLGSRTTLQLRFYGPGEGGAVVFCQELVCADCVNVLRVDEETVHVEEACLDGWWRGS